MYADVMTASMRAALEETGRRRTMQEAFNLEHGITPQSIVKSIDDVMRSVYERDYVTVPAKPEEGREFRSEGERAKYIASLEAEMREAARNLEFERAAVLRDRLRLVRSPVSAA